MLKTGIVFALAAIWLRAGVNASQAQDCAAAIVTAPLAGPLQPMNRVQNHEISIASCSRAGVQVLATRTMRVDGENLFLAVDPSTLVARLERAACWTCSPTTVEAQSATRFIGAVDRWSRAEGAFPAEGANWLKNAGLGHGHGNGVFVTGDLCPSRRPLDRDFLISLERKGEATPVALAITGLWVEHHARDFLWLRRERTEGRLAITFVNHSYHHPYRPGLPDSHNFLLTHGINMRKEIVDVERLLIANGETPSVFFRFPGLISDRALMAAVREAYLIPLGADAWLATEPSAPPGSIVLVHPNGNEPFGLNIFERLIRSGRMPQPLRPINEAP